MTDELRGMKDRLARRFLGRAGVHGLGVRRRENVICVYADAEDTEALRVVLAEIQKEAAPFRVLVIREPPPVTHPPGTGDR